eukprot:gene9000-1099_t
MLNMMALPPWILLVIAPRAKFTKMAITTTALVMSLAFLLFQVMEMTSTTTITNSQQLISMIKSITFSNLQEKLLTLNFTAIKSFFFSETGFLAIWSHYIIIDMVAGHTISKDARASNVSPILYVPCLLLTLLLAPVGYLVYFFVKNFNYVILGNSNHVKVE